MSAPPPYQGMQHSLKSYTVGWFAPLACERAAAEALRDEVHDTPRDFRRAPDDNLQYSWGKIGDHNIVIVSLGAGSDGLAAAASTTTRMLATCPHIRFGLLVGIGGAIPRFKKVGNGYQLERKPEIRLGDIVVSQPDGGHGGVVQYDYYKATNQGPEVKGYLNSPPQALLYGIEALKSKHEQSPSKVRDIISALETKNSYMVHERGYKHPGPQHDRLFNPSCTHPEGALDCTTCPAHNEARREPRSSESPHVHYGVIASGNLVVKDAEQREKLLDHLQSASKCLCYEMEAAGLMNSFPCLVIRGMCDYSDSHKNDTWHKYAALTAAAFAKELLLSMRGERIEEAETAQAWMEKRRMMKTEVERILDTPDISRKSAEIKSDLESVNINIGEAGTWFLNSQEFQKWKKIPGSFLWVYGIAGSGKTVLSTSVINHLDRDFALRNTTRVALHYYFDFQMLEKADKRRPLGQMLRSLLVQLSKTDDSVLERLYKHLEGLHNQPSESELSEILLEMTKSHTDVKIVIDALDEIEEKQREDVCDWIKDTLRRFSFFVTSRKESDIEEHLRRKCVSVEMRAGPDIEKYVLARIGKYKDKNSQKWSEESLRKIKDALLERVGGMFQWVVCQLDLLLDYPKKKSFGDSEIDEVLKKLPGTLMETYNQIIRRIPVERQQDAHRLLQFLLFCKRPIQLLEANEFLSMDPSGKVKFEVSKRIETPRTIVSYCASLITLHGELDTFTEISLAHSSVRDYLLSSRTPWKTHFEAFGQLEADKAIFRTSLSYIRFLCEAKSNSYYNFLPSIFPLASYATRYIFEHGCAAEEDEETAKELTGFFQDQNAFHTWVCHKSANTSKLFDRSDNDPESLDKIVAPIALYTAARYGLKNVLQALLERKQCPSPTLRPSPTLHSSNPPFGYWANDKSLSARTYHPISPLYAAAEAGHENVVDMLIGARSVIDNDVRFPIDNVGGPLGTALDVACMCGHVDAVEVLLKNAKLQHHSNSIWFENALDKAVKRGAAPLVQAFLDHGFLTHSARPSVESALFSAALHGNAATVSELLHSCRDLWNISDLSLPPLPPTQLSLPVRISAWIMSTLSAFSWFRKSSHENIAMKPVETDEKEPYKKDMVGRLRSDKRDQRARFFNTALQAAVFEGHEKIVKMLLTEKRDPNSPGGYFGTALQAAAAMDNIGEVVRMLLEAGADPNLPGGYFGTALQAAAVMGNLEVVRMLLNAGADPKLSGGYFGTAFQAATAMGNLEVAQMLLDFEPDPNLPERYFGTAFQPAIAMGNWEVAQMLHHSEAKFTARGGSFETALNAFPRVELARLYKKAVKARNLQLMLQRLCRGDQLGWSEYERLSMALLNGGTKQLRKRQKRFHSWLIESQTAATENTAHNSEGAHVIHTLDAIFHHKCVADDMLLYAAISRGFLKVVETMIRYGAPIDIAHEGDSTLLQYTLQEKGSDAMLTILRAATERPDAANLLKARGSGGMTILHYAAKAPVPSEKLERKCESSTEAKTLLRYNRRRITVDQLIEIAHKINILTGCVNIRDNGGHTALHCAASVHAVHGVTLLLRAGADPEAVNLEHQNFIDCARSSRSTRIPVFEVCPEVVGPFNSSIDEARAVGFATLLHQAVDCNDAGFLREIAQRKGFCCSPDTKSFVNIPDTESGMTPLHYSAQKLSINLAELLLTLGALPDTVDKDAMTPLHHAAKSGCLEMVTAILKRMWEIEGDGSPLFPGADYREGEENRGFLTGKLSDCRDSSGNTPLHYAVEVESIEIVKALVHCGATTYKVNKKAYTPLDVAREKKNAPSLEKLRKPQDVDNVALIVEFLPEEELDFGSESDSNFAFKEEDEGDEDENEI